MMTFWKKPLACSFPFISADISSGITPLECCNFPFSPYPVASGPWQAGTADENRAAD